MRRDGAVADCCREQIIARYGHERGAAVRCAEAGLVQIQEQGGAMQFTTNLSVYRLLSEAVDTVIVDRDEYGALRVVRYEFLPHLNRLDQAFLAKVQRYSERVPYDIVALEDGSAMIHWQAEDARCIGRGVRFRGGVKSVIEAAA